MDSSDSGPNTHRAGCRAKRHTASERTHPYPVFHVPNKTLTASLGEMRRHLVILKPESLPFHHPFSPSPPPSPLPQVQDSSLPQHLSWQDKAKAQQLSQTTPLPQTIRSVFPKSLFSFLLTHSQTEFLVCWGWVKPYKGVLTSGMWMEMMQSVWLVCLDD